MAEKDGCCEGGYMEVVGGTGGDVEDLEMETYDLL